MSVPVRIAKMYKGSNWDEKIERKLEDFKIWAAHGVLVRRAKGKKLKC